MLINPHICDFHMLLSVDSYERGLWNRKPTAHCSWIGDRRRTVWKVGEI